MPLSLRQTVAPTQEPLTIEELREHLRIDTTDEDALLLLYAQAAREQVERTTRRQLLTATYQLLLDGFSSCRVLLPRAPLQSVTSVAYLDTAGASQTLATSVYGVDTASEPGRLYLKSAQTWPSTLSQPQAVTVTYKAGWLTRGEVPGMLKAAMLLIVGHLYEHREATIEKALTMIPNGVERLLWLHRVEVL